MAFGRGHRRDIVLSRAAYPHESGEVSPRHYESRQRRCGRIFASARLMHPLLGGGLSIAGTILTSGG